LAQQQVDMQQAQLDQRGALAEQEMFARQQLAEQQMGHQTGMAQLGHAQDLERRQHEFALRQQAAEQQLGQLQGGPSRELKRLQDALVQLQIDPTLRPDERQALTGQLMDRMAGIQSGVQLLQQQAPEPTAQDEFMQRLVQDPFGNMYYMGPDGKPMPIERAETPDNRPLDQQFADTTFPLSDGTLLTKNSKGEWDILREPPAPPPPTLQERMGEGQFMPDGSFWYVDSGGRIQTINAPEVPAQQQWIHDQIENIQQWRDRELLAIEADIAKELQARMQDDGVIDPNVRQQIMNLAQQNKQAVMRMTQTQLDAVSQHMEQTQTREQPAPAPEPEPTPEPVTPTAEQIQQVQELRPRVQEAVDSGESMQMFRLLSQIQAIDPGLVVRTGMGWYVDLTPFGQAGRAFIPLSDVQGTN